MPAHKRPFPSRASDSDDHVAAAQAAAGGGPLEANGEPAGQASGPLRVQRDGDPDAAGGSGGGGDGGGDGGDSDSDSRSSMSAGDGDEFILVKLAEIRKEVQCPICLGIIRKTRTVMECLHRFCRDCIDKSMRLGNNECPACRTHCASRRSLRDDPNYDALIAALYPDIDKYEEEELAFSEEEKTRNKKIQATIAETFRRQSEVLGRKRSTPKATANAFARKSRGNMRTRKRGRTSAPDIVATGSDDEDREEGNCNDAGRESSSADDCSPDVRQKRGRRRSIPGSSPAKTICNSESGFEENDDLGVRESFTTSPLRGEMLAWGKNGTRSQTRHGNVGGSNGRVVKGGRISKLVDHLRNTDETDKEFNSFLVLLPLDGLSIPNLEKPYLSCQPTLSIQHLCEFIALQLSRQAEEVQIYIKTDPQSGSFATKDSTVKAKVGPFDGLERLREDKLLSELHPSLASGQGDLELLYGLKAQD